MYLTNAEKQTLKDVLLRQELSYRAIAEKGPLARVRAARERLLAKMDLIKQESEIHEKGIKQKTGAEKDAEGKLLEKLELKFATMREWQTMLEDAITVLERQAGAKKAKDEDVPRDKAAEMFDNLFEEFGEYMEDPTAGTGQLKLIGQDLLSLVTLLDYKSAAVTKLRRLDLRRGPIGSVDYEEIIGTVFNELYDFLFAQ